MQEVRRSWVDFQITSHIPFLFAVGLSLYFRFYELTVLISLVVFFSVQYHLAGEAINMCSYMDNCAAASLSMYGNVQLFFSPTVWIFALNLSLGLCALIIFALGFFKRCAGNYDLLHPVALHVLPAIWCCIVIVFHKPLIPQYISPTLFAK